MNQFEFKDFLKNNNLSVEDVSKLTGVSVRTVKSWEYGERNISKSALTILNNYTQSGNPALTEVKQKQYNSTIPVKVVTIKARAGYADSYYADAYLEDLPTVLIEADKEYKGKYLAFEVDGDSMEPDYHKGDIVICREIKRDLWQYKLHYKDYDFVIAHGEKGLMLKEITDHNPETGEIVCHSLNNEDGRNKDFTLNLKQVAFLYNVVEHRISGRQKRRNR